MDYNTAGNIYGDKAYEHAKPTDADPRENWLREGVQDLRTSEYQKRYEIFKKQHNLQEISELKNAGNTYTVETGDTMYPILTDYFGMNDHTAFLAFMRLLQMDANIDSVSAGDKLTLENSGRLIFEKSSGEKFEIVNISAAPGAPAAVPTPAAPGGPAAAPAAEAPTGLWLTLPPLAQPARPAGSSLSPPAAPLAAPGGSAAAPAPAVAPTGPWSTPPPPAPPEPSSAPEASKDEYNPSFYTVKNTDKMPRDVLLKIYNLVTRDGWRPQIVDRIKHMPSSPTKLGYEYESKVYPITTLSIHDITHILVIGGEVTEDGQTAKWEVRYGGTDHPTTPEQIDERIRKAIQEATEKLTNGTPPIPDAGEAPPAPEAPQNEFGKINDRLEAKVVKGNVENLHPGDTFKVELSPVPNLPLGQWSMYWNTKRDELNTEPLLKYTNWDQQRGIVELRVLDTAPAGTYHLRTKYLHTTDITQETKWANPIKFTILAPAAPPPPPIPDAGEAPPSPAEAPEAPPLQNEFEKIDNQLEAKVVKGNVKNLYPGNTFEIRLSPVPNLPLEQWNIFWGTSNGEPGVNSLLTYTSWDQKNGVITPQVSDTAPAGTYHLYTKYEHTIDKTQETRWADPIEFTILAPAAPPPPPIPDAGEAPPSPAEAPEALDTPDAFEQARQAALALRFRDSKGKYTISSWYLNPDSNELRIYYIANDESAAKFIGTIRIRGADATGNSFVYDIYRLEGDGPARSRIEGTIALKQAIFEIFSKGAPTAPDPRPDP